MYWCAFKTVGPAVAAPAARRTDFGISDEGAVNRGGGSTVIERSAAGLAAQPAKTTRLVARYPTAATGSPSLP